MAAGNGYNRVAITANEVRKTYHAQPFRPFKLRVAGGREYEVRHPKLMAISPRGQTVIVVAPDETVDLIDTLTFSSIHMDDNGVAENTPSPE